MARTTYNVNHNYSRRKKIGIGSILFHGIMLLLTGGLWIFVILLLWYRNSSNR